MIDYILWVTSSLDRAILIGDIKYKYEHITVKLKEKFKSDQDRRRKESPFSLKEILDDVNISLERKQIEDQKQEQIKKDYLNKKRIENLKYKIKSHLPKVWEESINKLTSILEDDFTQEEFDQVRIEIAKEWFKENKMGPISNEQLRIICNCENSLRVIARAGSGKTRTITYKIIFLIHYLNKDPSEILALTFNKKARLEL